MVMQLSIPKPANFDAGPSPEAILYARQFLKFKSFLRRADTMEPRRVDGIINHVIDQLMYNAVRGEGSQHWIVRDLLPRDLPPTSATLAGEWAESTGTTISTYVAAAIGNGTGTADDTFIGIYGAQFLWSEGRNGNADVRAMRMPVSQMRFIIGGTRVAEWDLSPIWHTVAQRGATSSAVSALAAATAFPVGIAESPIFIGQNTTVLIEFYENVGTTITDFSLKLHGLVVEKRGAGRGLNP